MKNGLVVPGMKEDKMAAMLVGGGGFYRTREYKVVKMWAFHRHCHFALNAHGVRVSLSALKCSNPSGSTLQYRLHKPYIFLYRKKLI